MVDGTLECLDLSQNHLGDDVDLDGLVLALVCSGRNTTFKKLCLHYNEIGIRGCTSLAKLLRTRESNIEALDLSSNNINDECVILFGRLVIEEHDARTFLPERQPWRSWNLYCGMVRNAQTRLRQLQHQKRYGIQPNHSKRGHSRV